MVEGMDRPRELPQDSKSKKTSNSSGKVVILDSGFCFLEGIVALKKVGVYAGDLIKKRRYWSKYVPDERIEEPFQTKDVSGTDSLYDEMDGVPYDIFCMKESNYIMKTMNTYGGLIVKDEKR